jgi:hypothetical protein
VLFFKGLKKWNQFKISYLFCYSLKRVNLKKLFLNWLFDQMILIQWTPFWHKDIKIWGTNSFSTITNETNNLIVDGHYSELGHRQLTNKFLEMINDDELRKTINSICNIDKLI